MFRRTAWTLFALSFVAVYREVFETVLFYSALAALAAIAWALLCTSAKMPIGKFFSITSMLVIVLAVILIGKGSVALQDAG